MSKFQEKKKLYKEILRNLGKCYGTIKFKKTAYIF